MKDFLHAIFSRGNQAATYDPVVSIGGVDYTSASQTYEVAHFSGGNLLVHSVNAAGTSTSIVSLSGTANVNVVQWGSSAVQSASFGVPTVGWYQRLDATNDAVTVYQNVSNSNWTVIASQSGNWTTAISGGTVTGVISAGTVTVSSVLSGTMSANILGQARTTDPAAAADGTPKAVVTDSLGKLVTLPGAVNDLHLNGQVATPGVLAQSLIATPGAGRRIAMQSILVTGSASQILNVIVSGGPSARTFGLIPVGYGGFAMNAGGAPLYITSASANLSVACDATATCNIFASGYSLSN